jgi:hypothetical protein
MIGTAAPRGTVYRQGYRPLYPGYYRYPSLYRSYYYNPFYYGSFGLGFYYNPFWWGFGSPWYGYGAYGWYGGDPYGWYGYSPYGGYGYGGYGRYRPADYATGEIQLKVKPKEAQVYVDGYFVGSVEDFDGWGKRLTVKAAPDPGQTHKIEIRYSGYETLSFETSMTPGQSITYRGEMKKVQPEQQPVR